MASRLNFLLAGLAVAGISVAVTWQAATTGGFFGNAPVPLVIATTLAAGGLLALSVLYLPAGSEYSLWRTAGLLLLSGVLFLALMSADLALYFVFGGDLRT